MSTILNNHLDFIDFAKGIGIILVVMGHTMFPLHEAIDVFHMPFFFFLSGITLKCYDKTQMFIENKINRLIIPYIFFYTFWTIINYVHPLLGDYKGPLWFLPCLFATIVLCELLVKKNSKLLCWIVLVLIILLNFLFCREGYSAKIFHFDVLLRAFPYLLLGFFFRESPIFYGLIHSSKRNVLMMSIVLFVSFLCSLGFLLNLGLFQSGDGFFNGKAYGRSVILIYVTSMLGIFSIFSSSIYVNKNAMINWLGKNSLIILCVHSSFTQYWNTWISTTTMYNSSTGKLLLALISYIVILVFCVPFILFFRKYLPSLTGYKMLFRF